jgi:hypothetical protein
MRARQIGVVIAVLMHGLPAAAQPGGASSGAPPPVPLAPDAREPSLEAGIRDDASSGRAWVSPTALTPPAGTFSAQSVELSMIGVGYSFTDRLVVSVTTLLPLPDAPRLGIANVKLKLVDIGRLKIAAHVNVDYVANVEVDDGDVYDDDVRAAGVAFLGGAATYCLDRGCHSILNGYASGGYLFHAVGVQRSVPFLGSLAWTQHVRGRMKLMLEAMGSLSVGEVDDPGQFAGWYGLRFASRDMALDVGLVKFVCDGCDQGDAVGLPWLAFAYRSL